ncbi:CobW family GTP-binding protein [Pseudomonas berkeleyensis]|uniref:Cobalamin biosynthesis protein CobW n=1 Tax=Pseudomonas berkeleyensis TaxID=2726956 RepID=A0A7G5DNM9_9PSED|nr:CobW family GTP-binding protein [Pseudomonas berkeleyensis]QMV63354.1 cobalamin biosynthesis protein CobW [Pseudomonas berkeleyensis]WSO38813.1 CobW family GTP-binding protein [Pseudomonas berkeleyensis]
MLSQIPTHLIAGPLGAGKTSLIRHLLAQKPAHERWAVLINEFGQIGLDAALLERGEDGIALAEVAGGCLCCVNGAPFQVGLGRLLRKVKPDRLLIEPSGLGHPAQLLEQLRQPPWRGVLAVQPALMVLDAAALASGQPLSDVQRQALDDAGLLLLNKSEGLDDASRARIAEDLPPVPLHWTEQGQLDLALLPGLAAQASPIDVSAELPTATPGLAQIWRNAAEPICLVQDQAEGWSIGWRWHPSQRFDLALISQWLQRMDWRRAKAVLHGAEGWRSLNALQGQALQAWSPSEWRKDSRLELIFAAAQDEAALRADMAACRL